MENEKFREKTKNIVHMWKTDYEVKTVISSLCSFSITVLFALYNGFLGVYLSSICNGSACIFYLLLVSVRGIILFAEKKSKKQAYSDKVHTRYKSFVISTIMLLLLNLALICPIVLMVKFEKPVHMGLIPAIAMAAYTTYKVTMASIHYRRQKKSKHNHILITELRTINFMDAMVSILTLQNTLIMVNSSKTDTDNMFTMAAISSAAIYIIIVFVTIRLLIIGIKQHRKGLDVITKS